MNIQMEEMNRAGHVGRGLGLLCPLSGCASLLHTFTILEALRIPCSWDFLWWLQVGMVSYQLCFQPLSSLWKMERGAENYKFLIISWSFW